MIYAAAFVVALFLGTWVIERRRMPAGVMLSSVFRECAPYHFDKAMQFAKEFELERQKRLPDITGLESRKWLFEKYARAVHMQLPNDLDADRRLKTEIDAAVRTLEDHIQVIRRRHPQSQLAFPYPFGDYFAENVPK